MKKLQPNSTQNSSTYQQSMSSNQIYMGVSKNRGTPKSSILIGFSIMFTIHFGVSLFLETPIYINLVFKFRTFCYPALRFGEGLSKRMHQINATPGIQYSGTPTNQKEVHTVHTTSLPASCNPEHRKHGDTGTSQ